MRPLSARLSALCVLAVAGLLASACTESGDTRAAGPQATVTAGVAASPDPSLSGSPSPSPTSEDFTPVTGTNPFTEDDEVVTIAVKDPATLDPMLIGDPGSTLVARQLYDGLTRWDARKRKVVPAVAQSWTVAAKGTKFTFKLREGLTFHDGTPVTARDFVFAFNRIARRENASDLAYVLGRVKGFAPVNQTGREDNLEGLRAPDDRTLIIELSEPDQDFPAVLTHPGLVPLSAEAVRNQDEFLRNPVGNGPFQMAQPWDVGGEIYLESATGALEQPTVDGLRMVPYEEAASSWLDFLEGRLDISEVPAGQIEDAGERFGDQNFKVLMNGYSYGFNLDSRVLGDINLRRAVNFAIDRQAIGRVVYNGIMKPPRGIAPPSVPGFQDKLCAKLCSYQPKVAKRLVSALRRKDRDLTLEYPREAPHDEVAQLMQKNLEAVGFKVKLEGLKFDDFFDLLQEEKHSVFRLTWLAEYHSPDAYLGALFESDSPDNHTGFSDKKVDDLLAQARAEFQREKRLELYARAEKLILEQVPVVPLGYFTVHWASQPEVSGLQVDATGTFDAAGIDLDTDVSAPTPSPSPSPTGE